MKIILFILSFSIFLSLIMLLPVFSFPGGPGLTIDEPYEIWDKTHWIELGDSLDSNMDLPKRDQWHADKHFLLMRDIDNTITKSISLNPICSYFHSNGKKITIVTDDVYSYIFSSTDALIDSLISDGYVTGLAASGIVYYIGYRWNEYGTGTASIGTVTNCINNTTLTSIYGYIGGITYLNQGTISHCINNGSVTGVDFVAGISPDSFRGKIFNCINTGRITATSPEIKELYDYTGVAGITIEAPIDLSNCINLGDIEGHYYVGGIASKSFTALGFPQTIISNCINAGYVKGKKYVGGIIGIDFDLQPADIYNCINTGIVEGEEDVGSIVGNK